MKNLLRRAVAFVLTACMLLSVMPPVALADTTTGVYQYKFVTSSTISNSTNMKSDVTQFTADGYEVAYFFKDIGRTDKTISSSTYTQTWVRTTDALFAVRLTGIEDVTASYSMSITTVANHTSPFVVYVMPGNTVADNVTIDYLTTNNYSTVLTVDGTANKTTPSEASFQITESDIRDSDGSVILVIANNGETNSNQVRVSGVTLTKINTDQIAADEVIALIDAIGEVTADSGEAITAARTAYDALTETQQALVTNIDTLTAAEEILSELLAFPPTYADGVYTYEWVTGDGDAGSNGYPTAVDNYYGNFAGYASNATHWKPQASNLQTQGAFASNGTYLALRFNVPAAGVYDVSMTMNNGNHMTYSIWFKPVSFLTGGNANGENATAVAGLTNPDASHTSASTGSYTVTAEGVSFDAAGDYLLILRNDTDYETTTSTTNLKFYGMTLTKAATDQEKADLVIEKINAIGTVTLDSEEAVTAAREAYDALTETQQALVTNIDTLTAAEASLNALKSDKAAAQTVIDQIAAIGEVTLDDEEAITAARAAYDALTETQKALVTNTDTLTAAEASLAVLKQEAADKAAAQAVIDQIDAIGEVALDDEEAITAARTAYDALTETQQDLVTNYATLTNAETALAALKLQAEIDVFQPEAVDGAYEYTFNFEVEDRPSNYPSAWGTDYYGNFMGYARSASIVKLYGTTGGYVQIGNNRAVGSWFAMKFSVAQAGDYDIALNIGYNAGDPGTTLDVYFVPVSALTAATGNADNQTAIDALTGHTVTVGTESTYELKKVALPEGEYLIVVELTSEPASNVNFYGMTLTPWVASDIATVTTNYSFDFTTLGALLGAAEGNHATFGYSAKAQNLFNAGKINYLPYAKSGSFYAENGWYGYGIFGQNSAAETFFAVKISAAVGTYDFNAAMTSYANAAGTGHIYAIPVSAVEAALAAAQATDEGATASDAIYNLIKKDYAGKHSVEGSFYGTSLSGTVEITADEDYVIVFYAVAPRSGRTTYWMHFKNFSLTKTASFNSMETALASTSSKHDTVTLIDDVDLNGADLIVSTGAVLDLNGYNLNATLNVVDGDLTDSSNGAGSVSSVTNVTKDNGSVLIKDGEIIRAYGYEAKQNGYKHSTMADPEDASKTIDTIEFWFDANFAEEVYAKLASAENISINAELKLNNTPVAIVDMDTAINEWLASTGLDAEGNDAGLCIRIAGVNTLKEGDKLTVTPIFEDSYGTSTVFGDAITYTTPAAAE